MSALTAQRNEANLALQDQVSTLKNQGVEIKSAIRKSDILSLMTKIDHVGRELDQIEQYVNAGVNDTPVLHPSAQTLFVPNPNSTMPAAQSKQGTSMKPKDNENGLSQ